MRNTFPSHDVKINNLMFYGFTRVRESLSVHLQKMQVTVASTNPIKVQCVKEAFSKVFTNCDINYVSLSVPSGM